MAYQGERFVYERKPDGLVQQVAERRVKKPVIIVGGDDFAKDFAPLLQDCSNYQVVAFALSQSYFDKYVESYGETFEGLPMVSLESLGSGNQFYQPGGVDIFVCIGYRDLNRAREKVINQCKEMGYEMGFFVHRRTTIEAPCETVFGEHVIILSECSINSRVQFLGDNIGWSNSHYGHGSTIREHGFISSNVCIAHACDIGRYHYIGSGTNIRDGVNFGEGSFACMSSVITERTVPAGSYVRPANISEIVPYKK